MTPDESSWPVAPPAADFVDQVMARVERERRQQRARRAVLGALACAAALAVAGGALLRQVAPVATAPRGEITAPDRLEIEVAPGVLAVLERYAHIVWGPAGVTQDQGDVFYRLAADRALTVSTPAGEIDATGACSRVKVEPVGAADAVAGAAEARGHLTPAVFVSVSQGQVDLRQRDRSVRLGAGRYALLEPSGVRTDDDDATGEIAFRFAHERVRRYAMQPPLPPPAPEAPPPARSATAPRPRPRLVAPPAASSAPPPAASSAPRVFIEPPCTCSPAVSICDCRPL